MLAECNSDNNLTIWALDSTKVISTTGGNLTQAWIKVNFGKLPDNWRDYYNSNGSNRALNQKEWQRWMTPFNNLCKINPREECQANITGSDKTLDEKKIGRKEKEELGEKDKDVEKEREVVEREKRKKVCVKMKKVSGKREGKKKVREKKKRTRGEKKESYEKPLPHPKKYHRKEREFERFMEILKKLEIKVPMIERH
ncbi:hypothetical protein LR48_Vigan08g040800 [Vigna angularis]|uniref:Uncharacterized protein n=1 Tax=Phaseolus angularis TaxID=3914 RepID=A0A0L9V3P1_PHAAN|nr:hypothetical protein LR48_Vigan08g040800 [Vigna angularis]